jgi:hypothetical protein
MRPDPYMPLQCRRCDAVGTIVEMGACCRIAELVLIDRNTELFRLVPSATRRYPRYR